MFPFDYRAAVDPAAAISSRGNAADTRYLAGGTTLLDLMKLDVERPTRLVDIGALPFGAIEPLPGGGLRVGALVRNSHLAWDERVRGQYPVLSQAVLAGASPQVRNMATTGGNLLQRTRCWYFRDVGSPCNKREPGSGCPAWDGDNRIHAVIGGSERCIAVHPSDMAVALVALDAVVRVRGSGGERTLPVAELYLLPGDHPERETALRDDELVVAVDLPETRLSRRSAFEKVRDRASFAFALASAAVALDLEGGVVREARIVLGGVGTRPWRVPEAEAAIVGRPPFLDTWAAAAEAALRDAVPRRHNAFKVELARRTLARALARAAA
jgi:xanthine dehydrogenase YagS FAD-binding subunit